jgi:hypothetical protein
VERALTLWRDGSITIGSLVAESGKKGKRASQAITKTINVTTGRESAQEKAFTEPHWGPVTRNYLNTIKHNLREDSWSKIVARAQAYAKLGHRPNETSLDGSMDVDLDDERAQLIDFPDDGKCSMSPAPATFRSLIRPVQIDL